MITSSKPRKQRFFRFNAPLHERQHFLHAHLDKSARTKLGIKRSSVQISKGDTVKVMAGSKKGTTGKVTRVNLRTGKINIDTLMKKNARGKEFNIPISANNVYITELNLSDRYRADKLKLKREVKEVKKEEPKPVEDTDKAPQGASTRAAQAEMAEALQNR